jgi:hypothetical protein
MRRNIRQSIRISSLGGAAVFLLMAQPPARQPSSTDPAATMKQIMLDLIYPASNEILLFVYRGGSNSGDARNENAWATVRRNALILSESENLLTLPGRARDQPEWMNDAKLLSNAGTSLYNAAQAKDGNALAALVLSLDASCTTCHRQYRPDVFPRDGESK